MLFDEKSEDHRSYYTSSRGEDKCLDQISSYILFMFVTFEGKS